MSCFIVSDAHISALAAFVIRSEILTWNPTTGLPYRPQEIGDMFHAENVKSWNARYPKDATEPSFHLVERAYLAPRTLVQILRAIECFEYQSCDHDEWPESDVAKLCQRMRIKAIQLLPGYSDAPWGIE